MSKSLKMVFKDEKENSRSISISNPKDNVNAQNAKALGDYVVDNEVLMGKSGKIISYEGASIVTRTEVKL